MNRKFLNLEEEKKIKSIQEILQRLDIGQYNNRFNAFSNTTTVINAKEVENWIKLLSEKISGKKYAGIYGIPRGGIILATLLSYKTNLPLLYSPCKGCLVVDDDMSTGITLLPYINRYDTAVMYINPNCPIHPDYYWKEYGEEFKVFYWNSDEDSR